MEWLIILTPRTGVTLAGYIHVAPINTLVVAVSVPVILVIRAGVSGSSPIVRAARNLLILATLMINTKTV